MRTIKNPTLSTPSFTLTKTAKLSQEDARNAKLASMGDADAEEASILAAHTSLSHILTTFPFPVTIPALPHRLYLDPSHIPAIRAEGFSDGLRTALRKVAGMGKGDSFSPFPKTGRLLPHAYCSAAYLAGVLGIDAPAHVAVDADDADHFASILPEQTARGMSARSDLFMALTLYMGIDNGDLDEPLADNVIDAAFKGAGSAVKKAETGIMLHNSAERRVALRNLVRDLLATVQAMASMAQEATDKCRAMPEGDAKTTAKATAKAAREAVKAAQAVVA
jgi:hypothetical protein